MLLHFSIILNFNINRIINIKLLIFNKLLLKLSVDNFIKNNEMRRMNEKINFTNKYHLFNCIISVMW
ncbi:hypothetical protein GCM10007342_07990 [Staphylococcus pragensis]|nr:hypothetical protein GCM10007342_07990 [Staphylococcus pragensis]